MDYDVTAIMSDIGIHYNLEGTPNRVNGFSSIEEANEHDFTFCSLRGEQAISSVSKSSAALILCNSSMEGAVHPSAGKGIIFVDDARIAFIKILNHIQNE